MQIELDDLDGVGGSVMERLPLTLWRVDSTGTTRLGSSMALVVCVSGALRRISFASVAR